MKSHSNENDQDKESKITIEKPASLSFLCLREALEGLIGKKQK